MITMIRKIKSKTIMPDYSIDTYASEIYTIEVAYDNGKVDGISVFPKKYPYPDIIIDLYKQSNSSDFISLDFSKNTSIGLEKAIKYIDGITYAISFAETELKPFIDFILSHDIQ